IPLYDFNGPRFKYWVRVSNSCGSVDSATAELVVVLEQMCLAWAEPGFEVAIWESITVSARVTTFSGTPISGVSVARKIVENPGDRQIFLPPLTTDANGIISYTYSRSTEGSTDFVFDGQDALGRS